MRRTAVFGIIGAAVFLAGCEGGSVGVSYGYNDPFYWNHYYYGRDIDIDIERPDRPDRPDRPPATRPPVERPPVARPLPARPPIHTPSRPSFGGGGGLRR
ncbi:MAG: hypothetical protein AAGF71_10895 [Pseudomonadota bacterium]